MNIFNNDKVVHFLCQFLFSERFTGHIELHFIYELLWKELRYYIMLMHSTVMMMMMIQFELGSDIGRINFGHFSQLATA